MSELSIRIQHRREELGMSQDELATLLGYSTKSSISKIETGVNDVPRNKLVELARALDTTVAYLLGLPDDAGHTYVSLVVCWKSLNRKLSFVLANRFLRCVGISFRLITVVLERWSDNGRAWNICIRQAGCVYV